MSDMYFSASRNAFLPGAFKARYVAMSSWPDDAIAVTDETFQEFIGDPPADMVRGSDDDGGPAWIAAPEPPPTPLDQLATQQRNAIDTSRDEAFAAGMAYTLPDGSEDVVQTRAGDKTNLLGLAVEARDLKAAGETGAVMEFRGEKNVTHDITPQEMIDLTSAALGYIKQVYAQSWARKDAIEAALAAEDREGIEAVVW